MKMGRQRKPSSLDVQFLMTLLEGTYSIINEDDMDDILDQSNDVIDLIDSQDDETDKVSNDLVDDVGLDDLLNDLDKDDHGDGDDNNEEVISIVLKGNGSAKSTIDKDIDKASPLPDSNDASSNPTINDVEIKVGLKNKEEETIKINLPSKGNDAKERLINVKLHNPEDEPIDLNDPNTIEVKIVDDGSSSKDEDAIFITKRDELLASDNPNFQISICVKTLIQLKESLDKLTNHIPKETMLVKTKYIIGDILENIVDEYKMILKDKDRCKKIIVKVFDLVISLRQYISQKYNELKKKAENSAKPEETEDISKQIEEVEKAAEEKKNEGKVDPDDELTNIDDLNDLDKSEEEQIVDKDSKAKQPNVNFKPQ